MQPNYKIKSAQKCVHEKKWTKKYKKTRGRSPRVFLISKFLRKFSRIFLTTILKIWIYIFHKNYLGSNANLMVCAKSAKCIFVILSGLEAAAAFTIPFKAVN